MRWIKCRRGSLEYTGALRRPDSYLQWAKTDGRAQVRSLASNRWFSLFGGERPITRQLWKEIRERAERPSLSGLIAGEVHRYLPRFAALAEECTSLPRAFPGLRRLVAVPRALCNAETLDGMFERLGRSPELAGLRGGQPLREFLCRELVAQLDVALRSTPPTSRRPMVARKEWLLIHADPSFEWAPPLGLGPTWYGHYFVYESKEGRVGWRLRGEIDRACDALQQGILGLAPPERQQILRAARLRPHSPWQAAGSR